MLKNIKKSLLSILIIIGGTEIICLILGAILNGFINMEASEYYFIRLGIMISLAAGVIVFFCAPSSNNSNSSHTEVPSADDKPSV